MPEKRAHKRANDRAHAAFLKGLKEEYSNLTALVVESYRDRLNMYLSGRSKEFLEQIGYTSIELELQHEWRVAEPEVIKQVKATRGVDIPKDKEVLHIALLRRHFIRKKEAEVFSPWGSVFYQTKDLKTRNEVEIAAYASFLGFFTEKGIEHSEAERQQIKHMYSEENLKKVQDELESSEKEQGKD